MMDLHEEGILASMFLFATFLGLTLNNDKNYKVIEEFKHGKIIKCYNKEVEYLVDNKTYYYKKYKFYNVKNNYSLHIDNCLVK